MAGKCNISLTQTDSSRPASNPIENVKNRRAEIFSSISAGYDFRLTGPAFPVFFRRTAGRKVSERTATAEGEEVGTTFAIRVWPCVCVHGKGRTTKDHEDAARESTGRSKVAAPLTAPAAEEKCRIILYAGTIIRTIYYRPLGRCCNRRCSST